MTLSIFDVMWYHAISETDISMKVSGYWRNILGFSSGEEMPNVYLRIQFRLIGLTTWFLVMHMNQWTWSALVFAVVFCCMYGTIHYLNQRLLVLYDDDVIKLKHFRCCWPFVWGESTGHRRIPLTKASDAELWRFRWPSPEQTVEQTIETPVIWYAIALIMTPL